MLAFDIRTSFADGSKGRLECCMIDKHGECQLGTEAWRIGFKAFELLGEADRDLVCDADRLRDFVKGWMKLTDEQLYDLQSMIDKGQANIIDKLSGEPVKSLGLADRDWPSRLRLSAEILQQMPQYSPVDAVANLAGIFIAALFHRLDDAVIAAQLDDHTSAVDCTMDAAWFLQQLESADKTAEMAASELKRLDSRRASQRAQRRHAVDPKRRAKDFAKECWQAWRAEPGRYLNATEFARSMLDKFPDVLKSEVVVTRWVRQWDKEPK